MIITLELPPEAEANLVAQAKARGLSLDAFVRTIITTQAAAIDAVKPVQSLTQEEEELDNRRAFSTLFRFRPCIATRDLVSMTAVDTVYSLLQSEPSTPNRAQLRASG
jgi:hypothetical protein